MSKATSSSHHFRLQVKYLPWLGLAALLLYQAWMFYFRLPLSLGPRVIFEPWALRNGYFIYENITDLHSPFMPWLLTVLGYIIPNGLRLAKLTLVGLLSLSTLFTFLVARRYLGNWAGLAAAALFVLWAPTIGFGKLWYEAFLAPAYLIYLLAYRPSNQPRTYKWWLFWGLFGGFTVLIKQHAAPVLAAFLIWEGITALNTERSKVSILCDLIFTGLISFIPLGIAFIFQIIQTGSAESMFYWIITYSFEDTYSILASNPPNIGHLKFFIEINLLLLPALLGFGILVRTKNPAWKEIGLWLCTMISGAFVLYPRYGTWKLQPILAIFILLAVWIVSIVLRSRQDQFTRAFSIGVVGIICVYWLLGNVPAHVSAIRNTEPRLISEYSEPEALAGQIREVVGEPKSIYIFVDDEATSNLYYLLNTPPPQYWIFHYPWYMTDNIKSRILASLQESPPEWIVYLPGRWEMDKYAPELINYVESNYQAESTLTFFTGPALLMRRIPGR